MSVNCSCFIHRSKLESYKASVLVRRPNDNKVRTKGS